MSTIIRHIQDQIEFFTDTTTKQSGISISGLALLCGVNQSTITRLLDNLMHKTPSKWLQPLVGKDLTLCTARKQGGQVKVISAFACSKVIQHYAFQGVEVAQYSLDKFSEIGINTWIQGITKPQQHQLPAKSQQRINAREYLIQARRDFQSQHNLGIKESYRQFVKLYNAGSIPVPEWVKETKPRCSYQSLYNWEHDTSETYGGRRGKTKIAQNPHLEKFLEAQTQANPDIKPPELHRLASSKFEAIPSPDSFRRWQKRHQLATLTP